MKKIIILILCLSFFNLYANESETQDGPSETNIEQTEQSHVWGKSYWKDFKIAFLEWPLKGFVTQFQTKNNLYYAGAAIPSLWYAFDQDDRLSALGRSKEMPKAIDIVGDLGVLFNFPVIPISFYAWGLKSKNNHHIQFAAEYAASLYLALIESGLLSFIQVHERPDQSGLNFFETAFRGDSSFPSGHIIPYAALTFKTLQFYGPAWALPPLVLTVMASMQRVYDGRHFVSDVVGGFFLAAFASEGVRKMAGYKKNHPFYKWMFEHDAQLGIIRHRGAIGPRVAWSF